MRRLFIALLFAAAAMRAIADEPPRFFIERVDVRGTRHVSRDVVVAESRLRESHTYSEAELREAAARVGRAPYLLSADFALEKGSERGRFVLVITVTETKPFFFRLDLVPVVRSNPGATEIAPTILASDNDIALGVRVFSGRRGEFHAGLEGAGDNRSYTADYTSYVVGYTRYDIFGTRAFATLNAKKPQESSGGSSSIDPQVVIGIPLSLNQTLTAEYDPIDIHHTGDQGSATISQKVANIRWSYNTTNHPLLPTRGTYVTLTPIAIWHDSSGTDFVSTPRGDPYIVHDRSFGIEVSANRWWEFGSRNSAGAGVVAGFADIEESGVRKVNRLDGERGGSARFGTIDCTVSHSFWSSERVAHEGDSRIQVDARFGTRTENRGPFHFASGNVRQASLSWVRQWSWGLVRIGAGYAW